MSSSQPHYELEALDRGLIAPVNDRNPFEGTVERLVQMIKLGIVPMGERFPPERDLAAHLQVSRVTLRSAIRALQQAGYVRSQVGRAGGNFVIGRPEPSRSVQAVAESMGEDLRDALRFRSVIEPGAARLAAQLEISKSSRQELASSASAVQQASATDYRLADARFHLAIGRTSGSASLVAAIAGLQSRLGDLLQAIPLIEEALNHSNDQHVQILDAIFAGDPSRAGDAMEAHVDATASLVMGFLQPATRLD